MKRTNMITICKDTYENKADFENAVKQMVMLLINNNYVCVVDYDEKSLGIVSIEFNYSDQSYGDYYPYWLLPEEQESVVYQNDNLA